MCDLTTGMEVPRRDVAICAWLKEKEKLKKSQFEYTAIH
jgi:hypothetical protein